MGRHAKAVRYKKIGLYWYYKTPEMSAFKSTGQKVKAMAERTVMVLLQKNLAGKKNPIFREYACKFYVWGECPHVTRLLAEGKSFSKRYCDRQRGYLEKYVFPSYLGSMKLDEIKRGNLLDFRAMLQNKGVTGNSINSIMKAVKVVFSEAVYREDIPYNPATGLGTVKTNNKEAGIFSEQELKAMFIDPQNNLVWQTPADYICFLIAAATGMRSSEILALHWRNVNIQESYIHIAEAWKDNNHTLLGKPKNNKDRDVIIPEFLKVRLIEYLNITKYNSPDDLVVCTDEGKVYTIARWQTVFKRACIGIGITEKEKECRHLKPHSFRHTLNTLLREKGVNPDIIRIMLGWADENIQQNYTHFNVARMIKQGELIDTIFLESTEPA